MAQVRDVEAIVSFLQACSEGEVEGAKKSLRQGVHPDSRGLEIPQTPVSANHPWAPHL